jgi:hypothetical protein
VQVLHFNGQAWSVVSAPSPAFDSSLRAVAALAPNNVWAVGSANAGPTQTLIEHFDGTNWSVVPSPNAGGTSTFANNALGGVAAISANDIWAVGTFTDPTTDIGRTLTEHFNGTSWSIIASPNPTTGQNSLNGVTALSTGTIVAVGFSIDGSGDTNGLILQNGANPGAAALRTATATDPVRTPGVAASTVQPASTTPATGALDGFFALQSSDGDDLLGGLAPSGKRRR